MDIHVGLQAQTAAASKLGGGNLFHGSSTAITTGVCFPKIRKVMAFWFQEKHERNTGKPVTMLWLFCFRDVILGLGIPWDTLGYLGSGSDHLPVLLPSCCRRRTQSLVGGVMVLLRAQVALSQWDAKLPWALPNNVPGTWRSNLISFHIMFHGSCA
jgi:hypothetical protein